jgi:hypothetical protein
MVSFFTWRVVKCADEPAFRASYSRSIEKKSEMSCQPQSSRVSDALAVDNENIGRYFEFPSRFYAHRGFPERKQTGYIRESYFGYGFLGFYDRKIAEFEHDDCGADFFAVFAESTVEPGDGFGIFLYWGKFQFGGQVDLQTSGLGE